MKSTYPVAPPTYSSTAQRIYKIIIEHHEVRYPRMIYVLAKRAYLAVVVGRKLAAMGIPVPVIIIAALSSPAAAHSAVGPLRVGRSAFDRQGLLRQFYIRTFSYFGRCYCACYKNFGCRLALSSSWQVVPFEYRCRRNCSQD